MTVAKDVRGAAQEIKRENENAAPRRGRGRPRKDGLPAGSEEAKIKDEAEGKTRPPPEAKAQPGKGGLPPLPPLVLDFVSELPIYGVTLACEAAIVNRGRARKDHVKLPDPDPKSLEAVHQAFREWLESLEIEIGPGVTLILAYLAIAGEIGMNAAATRAMMEMEIAIQKAAEKAAEKKAQAPEGVPTTPGGGKVIDASFTREG